MSKFILGLFVLFLVSLPFHTASSQRADVQGKKGQYFRLGKDISRKSSHDFLKRVLPEIRLEKFSYENLRSNYKNKWVEQWQRIEGYGYNNCKVKLVLKFIDQTKNNIEELDNKNWLFTEGKNLYVFDYSHIISIKSKTYEDGDFYITIRGAIKSHVSSKRHFVDRFIVPEKNPSYIKNVKFISLKIDRFKRLEASQNIFMDDILRAFNFLIKDCGGGLRF